MSLPRRRRRFLVAVVVCCVAAGVLARAHSRAYQTSAAIATLHVSGGFKGLDRYLELRADGTATIVDARRKVTRTLSLEVGDRADIHSLLAQVAAGEMLAPTCRDCFRYELRIVRDGASIVVRADDLALREDHASQVIRKLAQLVNRALQGDPQ